MSVMSQLKRPLVLYVGWLVWSILVLLITFTSDWEKFANTISFPVPFWLLPLAVLAGCILRGYDSRK
jgi:phosphoglycerol transferase MdoB-like AlkP superfamily enzyme